MKIIVFCLLITVCFSPRLFAQENQESQGNNEGQLHGNFQLDAQAYAKDTLIGAKPVPEKFLMNAYANFIYTKGKFTAGVRFESYLNTLQGYDKNLDGQGIPYRFATYKADELEITVGNYYEQFGSGLIFRTYEDKSLGYDNAMDGIRLRYEPRKGISIKGLIGVQRFSWEKSDGIVRGADGEINANELLSFFADKKTQIIIGGSFVSKYQKSQDPIYNLPENVAAFAGRLNISREKININGEYAFKYGDPSGDNQYIYKNGEALLVNATYSQKGLGIMLGAKRVDNMSFRSDRNANLQNLNINYLPVITKTQAYSLVAMYPFATQPNGEIGAQGEIMYKFKKESLLGGKYGTEVSVNFSIANSLRKIQINDTIPLGASGTDGYKAMWLDAGKDLYYQDFNIEVNKKINDRVKAVVMYQNLVYNYDILRGTSGHGKVYANTGVLDVTYKFTATHALRTEMQALFTKQDFGNWAMLLLEYSMPGWFFSACDQYNYGNEDAEKRLHYYTVSVGYTKKGNRFQIGYGRQREGILCVGGVCRSVPAANGLTLSISSTF